MNKNVYIFTLSFLTVLILITNCSPIADNQSEQEQERIELGLHLEDPVFYRIPGFSHLFFIGNWVELTAFYDDQAGYYIIIDDQVYFSEDITNDSWLPIDKDEKIKRALDEITDKDYQDELETFIYYDN